MAPLRALQDLQARMLYAFRDPLLLEKVMIAGDSNSDDREGHRGMAQLGDSIMGTVILSDGLERGLSRKQKQDTCSDIRSKAFCSRIAKVLRLHELVKLSDRQMHVGIQPTTLKNAVAALVGAVWLDSHDFNAVLRVMEAIGLVNHMQYYDELQETLLMDVESTSSFGDPTSSYNDSGFGEKDHIDGDYWSLLPEKDGNLVDLMQLPSASGFASSTEFASTVAPATEDCTPVPTPPSSPDGFGRTEAQADQEPLTPSTSCDRDIAPKMLVPHLYDIRAQAQEGFGRKKAATSNAQVGGRVVKCSARKGHVKEIGRPRADSSVSILVAYQSQEAHKDITPQERVSLENVMKAYQIKILQAPTTVQRSLALLATSIGDSSALLLLKEALQALRSPHVLDYMCIDRQMSISERIHVIGQVGACTALLRLVRLLHIVTLWEDLSRMIQDGSDRFIVATPESCARRTTRTGNPLNLARTEVAQGFSDSCSNQDGEPQHDNVNQKTRLRRLGQRLGLVVRKWGQGALLTLGQSFSESRIMAPSDRVFEDLITLIDRSEGARIAAISAAALPLLQDFRRGNQSIAKVRLESLDDDAILSMPRLSTGFEGLLVLVDDG